MNKITRRSFLGITATGLGGLAVGPAWSWGNAAGSPKTNLEALYDKFKDPDRRYSICPFWFWNGKLEGAELRRQIKQMVEHGVYGAYVHNRDGLETPYLSEEWWQVVGEALRAAKDYGFSLCMVDEFEWPSGEARDYWLPGVNKSRVVAANHNFQMRRLQPTETAVHGPRRVRIPLPPETAVVAVARQIAPNALDGASLKTLPFESGAKELEWDAPDGEWIVFTYALEWTMGQPDHGTVDLMSREAISKYIDIYYDEFYRRYPQYFGNALPATFADHEGDYGAKLPWTPKLFETFERKAGYSLPAYLPALTYDIGLKTEKVRCDLLDTVSELYSENFFKQVTDWCRQHKIAHSGHVWEESLFFGPAEQGDFFRILRSMSNPGCDTLLEWGRQSVWLKEVASVADFEGRHVVCENQGVQGEDSYLSPERMKRVSNCLGAWNIGEFIPHAFDYDLTRTNFPPDWFRSQPYLAWFRAYADLMRRISFMNRNSRLVADILLFYPQVSIWGQSAPAFHDQRMGQLLNNSSWSDDAVDTNQQFAELKLRLSAERLDYQVADDHYMAQSRMEGGRLRIAHSDFRVLILPPMSTIRRATAERVRDFFRAGGTVIALRRLPETSSESGRNDAALKAIWDDTFDHHPASTPFILKRNSQGGRAYFVPESVTDALAALRQVLTDPDVGVAEGPLDHLDVLHKIKNGAHFYWVVNDTAEPRTNLLSLRAKGRPERWDANTGKKSPLFYQTAGERTLVRLALGPWDAAYVVFDAAGPAQRLALSSTNLDELYITHSTTDQVTVRGRALATKAPLSVTLGADGRRFRGEYSPQAAQPLEITGEWKVTVEAPAISLPYAWALDDPDDRGIGERWYGETTRGRKWNPLWLSAMNHPIRQWNVMGPFPNPQDHGLKKSYPPEQAINYEAVYTGDGGRKLHWLRLNAADYEVVPKAGTFGIGTMEIDGGPYSDESFVVNYGKALRLETPDGVIFAQTNVYSPQEADGMMLLASANPSAAFVNGSKIYSRWLRPLYNRLIDGFAARIPVRLRSGWNSVLLKFLHNPEDPKAPEFTCRIEQRGGDPIPNLFSSSRALENSRPEARPGYRWLRFHVPPLAGALIVPKLQYPRKAFIGKTETNANSEITLPKGTRVITLRVSAGEILTSPFAFSTTPASLPLGTWKVPGLEHFSGQMAYEKDVNIPAGLLKERVLLDCGEVGVVAEAWINGTSAGSRAWAPYAFDVTEHLREGSNHLKVRIANTDANARAVGRYRSILQNIDLDGWHGPAQLTPYVDREIQCHRI